MFQLSPDELESLKSQIVTSSYSHGGRRKPVWASAIATRPCGAKSITDGRIWPKTSHSREQLMLLALRGPAWVCFKHSPKCGRVDQQPRGRVPETL